MHRVLLLLLCACVQKPPRATVVLNSDTRTMGHAVLAMPTDCVAPEAMLCTPATYVREVDGSVRMPVKPTFAAYIDDALRLKLELAGFTLAEAATMRLQTADRIDHTNSQTSGTRTDTTQTTQIVEGEGPKTVAELPMPEVLAIAKQLQLTSILESTLSITRIEYGQVRGELVVSLLDIATMKPRWTVTCGETLYSPMETPNRLANCVGNGILVALAPENLIGKAL